MIRIEATGNLGRDAELRWTRSGTAVLSLSVPSTPRRYNRETQRWEDAGDTTWLDASLWGEAAETWANAGTLVRGRKVTITGTLTTESYTRRDGGSGTSLKVRVDALGIDDRKPATPQPQPAGGGQPGDPWATGQTFGDDGAPF